MRSYIYRVPVPRFLWWPISIPIMMLTCEDKIPKKLYNENNIICHNFRLRAKTKLTRKTCESGTRVPLIFRNLTSTFCGSRKCLFSAWRVPLKCLFHEKIADYSTITLSYSDKAMHTKLYIYLYRLVSTAFRCFYTSNRFASLSFIVRKRTFHKMKILVAFFLWA